MIANFSRVIQDSGIFQISILLNSEERHLLVDILCDMHETLSGILFEASSILISDLPRMNDDANA